MAQDRHGNEIYVGDEVEVFDKHGNRRTTTIVDFAQGGDWQTIVYIRGIYLGDKWVTAVGSGWVEKI